MSDRERWIVYPLLFLALGSAMIDKIMPREAQFTKIRCNELQAGQVESFQVTTESLNAHRYQVIVNSEGKTVPMVTLTRNPPVVPEPVQQKPQKEKPK